MGCSQNNKKQEGISKGLPSRVESESKAEKVGQSVAGSSNQSASVGKVQVLTASDFRKKIMDYESHPMSGCLQAPVLPLSISMPPGVDLAR